MNALFKTRTYLVGHMQYASGRDWREYVEGELEPLGIRIFNPYKKPFVKDVDEDEETRLSIDHCMEHGYFNDVAERMKLIRSYDLNLVDRSDFIIAHLLDQFYLFSLWLITILIFLYLIRMDSCKIIFLFLVVGGSLVLL